MASLNAYLAFNGQCREAMSFYRSCLGGELILNTVGDSPLAVRMPAGRHDDVIHSTLSSGRIVLMASDTVSEEGYRPGNTVSLCLICESKAEMDKLFSGLAEGGQVRHPPREEPFGWFAALTDKFGFSWVLKFGATTTASDGLVRPSAETPPTTWPTRRPGGE
jgi:PhnB protein